MCGGIGRTAEGRVERSKEVFLSILCDAAVALMPLWLGVVPLQSGLRISACWESGVALTGAQRARQSVEAVNRA